MILLGRDILLYVILTVTFLAYTPRKTNMEAENEPLEEEIPIIETIIFRFHVSFRGGA